jgi:hypothetical protein
MDYPLGDNDIMELLKGQTRVMMYDELANVKNIEDVLQPYGSVAILYPGRTDTSGHWVAVFYRKQPNGSIIIEFFDPYGLKPEDEWARSHRPHNNQHYLAALLYKTKFPIEYNDKKLQRYGKGVATCGRHVVNRILHSDLSLDDYNRLYGTRKGLTADKLVTYLTNEIE